MKAKVRKREKDRSILQYFRSFFWWKFFALFFNEWKYILV